MTYRIQPIIDSLSKIPTKKLLNLKNSFYSGDYYYPWEDFTPDETLCLYNKVKEELAKRPHIPNKKESKELRKQRKKEGKKNGKVYINRIV